MFRASALGNPQLQQWTRHHDNYRCSLGNMTSGSDFIILLLVFVTCSLRDGVVANDCERNNDNVIEASNCLGEHTS